MDRKKIKAVLFHIFQNIIMLLTLLFVLFLAVFMPLLEHGLTKPLGSLEARQKFQTYLTEAYPEEALRVTFPRYNLIMEDFSARVRGHDGAFLFGVVYDPNDGSVTERNLTDNGRYLTTPREAVS